jgi:hypothetical protein
MVSRCLPLYLGGNGNDRRYSVGFRFGSVSCFLVLSASGNLFACVSMGVFPEKHVE